MHSYRDTILLVCSNRDEGLPVLERLFDHGFSVVGPVSTGAVAMAVAGHAFPTVAVMVDPPAGRRTAEELARDLMTTWGIRSHILEAAREPVDGASITPDAWWGLRPGQAARLRSVLDGRKPDEDDARWYGGPDCSAGSEATATAKS